MSANNQKNEVAVVLSGGGALAAFETGVLAALFGGKSPATGKRLLEAGIFTGTSAGSFNAAVMAMFPIAEGQAAAKHLADIWINQIAERPGKANGVFRIRGNPLQFLDLAELLSGPAKPFLNTARDAAYLTAQWMRRTVDSVSGDASLSNRALRLFDISEFFCSEPFRQTLATALSPARIRRSGVKLRIAATDWRTGAARIFSDQDMTDEQGLDIVLASSAIPGIFPASRIGTNEYVDGGLVMNTPLSTALEAGATELHVIYLFPPVTDIPVQSLKDTVQTFNRVYSILLATKLEEDIATARWINQGLAVIEKAAAGAPLSDSDAKDFTRVAAQFAGRAGAGAHYRKLTIHRYFPDSDLGGALGLLNFERRAMERLIELGYKNGVEHDCGRNGCLIA